MMIVRPLLVAAIALGTVGCAQTPQERLAVEAAQASAVADLDKALAGLTPRTSSSCMPQFPTSQVKAYGPTIVYTVSNNLKYRSDTAGGCERIARGDVLVTRTTIGQLCQGDIATTIDPGSRMFSGSCSFGPFVRYDKGS